MTSKSYTIKEVRVHLKLGAEVVAEVASVNGLAMLLADLASANLETASPPAASERQPPEDVEEATGDTPEQRIETKAGLASGSLSTKKVVVFKDNIPQLLRPNAFAAVSDAALALIFSYETGLKKSSIEYEAFKGLFESQNIKSGSPLRMILANLRRAGYLDKTKYAADKSVSLTAKGETKAVEVLSGQCG